MNLRTSGRRFLGGAGAERKLGVGKNQVNWSVAKIVGQNINSGRRKTSEDEVRLVVVGEEGEHPVHQRVQLDEALT